MGWRQGKFKARLETVLPLKADGRAFGANTFSYHCSNHPLAVIAQHSPEYVWMWPDSGHLGARSRLQVATGVVGEAEQ